MTDLRDWLAAVDGIGELQVVEGAGWKLEIGGISELNYKRKPTLALLFDHVKDYPPGFRVLARVAEADPAYLAEIQRQWGYLFGPTART